MRPPPLVLLSGGSRGLGLAIARSLLASNYRVATFSRKSTAELEKLRTEYPDLLTHLAGDMAESPSLTRVVGTVEKMIGPIEVLINNAGIAHDGVLAGMPPEQIERLIQVNLTGSLLLSRLVIRRMLLRNAGNIINISSIIGLRGYSGLAAYSATKAGMDGMTRALARELGSRNIRVNAIAPGISGDRDDARVERLSERSGHSPHTSWTPGGPGRRRRRRAVPSLAGLGVHDGSDARRRRGGHLLRGAEFREIDASGRFTYASDVDSARRIRSARRRTPCFARRFDTWNFAVREEMWS